MVEGNHYFLADTINREYFKERNTHTTCSWKGGASYYTITVEGQEHKDAAWYCPARNLRRRIASVTSRSGGG